MRNTRKSLLAAAGGLIGLGAVGYFAMQQGWIGGGGGGIAMDGDDIAGVVTSTVGPEAGVWVIAETTDLPTKFARIVVTDDQGRYLIPDLPSANYEIWVRGYGLVDSPKTVAAPGRQLDLTAVAAPDAKSAAQYYPALYWYSMLEVPPADQFPGTGAEGNGIPAAIETQAQWVRTLKTEGCYSCHQLGNKATREIPASLAHLESTVDAWTQRIQAGQAGGNMVNNIGRLDAQRALNYFADWTDRIEAGEVPAAAPERPKGAERNVVVTLWDWGRETGYLHDEVASDRRDPTVNANGPIFGSPELSTDFLPVLDPVNHVATEVKIPVRDTDTPSAASLPIFSPSPYFGEQAIWDSQANVHNPMYDAKGRVWLTARIRAPETPDFCKAGSDHPSAKLFPLERSGRQAAVYDRDTKEFKLIDLCFSTHHLQFDKNDRLFFSGSQQVLGWVDMKKFDETGDEQQSQAWTAFVLDTNANGKRDAYVEPGAAPDPAKDTRVNVGYYGVAPSPLDGSIWGSVQGFPGSIVRVALGDNPPETALSEVYEIPFATTGAHSPRGMDVDREGRVWLPLQSGHLSSFDRRLCKAPLNGPSATGKHCPEGWVMHQLPGPNLKNVEGGGSAEAPYYTWVDQWNTFGLGEDVPLITGNAADALIALKDGEFVTLRVPYPMGFFAKGLDGRIDDPDAGWKGRGLWSTYGNRTPFHIEGSDGPAPGGKGMLSKVVKFQLRPDPLAH
jgi:hypothetical protein